MHYELLGSGLGGLFVAWLVWRALQRRKIRTSDWMPHELRASRLAYAEQLFRSAGPVSVSARVDRAYRDQAGVVTLVELKTRKADRVYLSDVIELSAQRFALGSQTGDVVNTRGYVVAQIAGLLGSSVHQVDLMVADEVQALVARRQAVLKGTVEPRQTCRPGLCRSCAFLQPCRDEE